MRTFWLASLLSALTAAVLAAIDSSWVITIMATSLVIECMLWRRFVHMGLVVRDVFYLVTGTALIVANDVPEVPTAMFIIAAMLHAYFIVIVPLSLPKEPS